MPEESNDRSLAMTSSFSSMMMAAVTIFLGDSVFTDAIAPFLVITKRNLTKQIKLSAINTQENSNALFILVAEDYKG